MVGLYWSMSLRRLRSVRSSPSLLSNVTMGYVTKFLTGVYSVKKENTGSLDLSQLIIHKWYVNVRQ